MLWIVAVIHRYGDILINMAMREIKAETAEERYGDMSMASSKKAVYFPTTNFDNKILPEAADWEPGKTYVVTLKLRMTGISIRKNDKGKDRGDYNFDIVGVDPQGEAKEAKGTVKRYGKDS